ncbi:MAG: hypothetical protein WKG01_02240 [Kofleriaceae bacterium]
MLVLAVFAGCSRADVNPKLDDGAVPIDAQGDDAAADAPLDGMAAAYSHTITIDGNDDFVAADTFTTTSASYTAKVSWDSEHVYLGYAGPDLDPAAPQAATKWLFAYVDVDPGAATGAITSQLYRTQRAAFPSGFGAEYYARWKCDASLVSLEQHQAGDTWVSAATPASARTGTFVELAIPRAVLGPATTIGVVTWMINEQDGVEASYAGLYTGNFTDGYTASLPITKYLRIDFASPRAPNDPANQVP